MALQQLVSLLEAHFYLKERRSARERLTWEMDYQPVHNNDRMKYPLYKTLMFTSMRQQLELERILKTKQRDGFTCTLRK